MDLNRRVDPDSNDVHTYQLDKDPKPGSASCKYRKCLITLCMSLLSR